MSDWVDKHSVNCFMCGELVDERECLSGMGNEGDICPKCQPIVIAAPDLLTACEEAVVA